MPSVKNPNGPSKNRLVARAAKARKQGQKRSTGAALDRKGRVAKADAKRGARTGILPTSGPNAALSSKKRRKLERKMGYAMKRKMEAEGEVEMKDVDTTEANTNKSAGEEMAVDTEEIS